MNRKQSRSGRVIVELDGYSKGYKAYIQNAPTGIVSLPGKWNHLSDDELADIAKECLICKEWSGDNLNYWGAKIVRKLGRIF